MPTPDDELRDLFAKGRATDRASAPSFDATWAAAQQKRGGTRLRVAVAIAAAAAILLLAGWIVFGTTSSDPNPSEPQIAETNPLPDIPGDETDDTSGSSDELAALAAWEPELATPTDFLLDEDGVLGGGMPSSDLSDSVLDLDELTMEL